jgi:hypothetical protein
MISHIVDVLVNIDGETMGYEDAEAVSIAAHDTSSLSAEYRAAIERVDRMVGDLVAAVKARPTYGQED